MMRVLMGLGAVTAAGLFLSAPAEARFTERVKTACTSDYLQYCGQYPPEHFLVIDCMRKHSRKLTDVCREAVSEDGVGSSSSRKKRRRNRDDD
jgi:hypothetical protein